MTDEELGEDSALSGVLAGCGTELSPTELSDRESELIESLATITVRRTANRHGCAARRLESGEVTRCLHPDHQRDVDDCREVLLALGLPGHYPELTGDDYREFIAGYSGRLPHHGDRVSDQRGKNWANSFSTRRFND